MNPFCFELLSSLSHLVLSSYVCVWTVSCGPGGLSQAHGEEILSISLTDLSVSFVKRLQPPTESLFSSDDKSVQSPSLAGVPPTGLGSVALSQPEFAWLHARVGGVQLDNQTTHAELQVLLKSPTEFSPSPPPQTTAASRPASSAAVTCALGSIKTKSILNVSPMLVLFLDVIISMLLCYM